MCGIVGVLDKKKKTTLADVEAMSQCMSHRGPDDAGLYADETAGVFLAQQRLSLIDLSPSGHQPMTIGSQTIVYNGEVYNFDAIRSELEQIGVKCSGDSDTEVVLRAWMQWGTDSLKKFRGMFAFVIWDTDHQTVLLCRDRVGVKPLYLYQDDNLIIFASEIKAILQHPAVERSIDKVALQLFLQLGYVPAPHSIFENIEKVQPAHYLTIDANHNIQTNQYWSPTVAQKKTLDEKTALKELDDHLQEVCHLRMIADVPVGVFLSGGIDSSLVTAVLKKQGYENLSTFTIGFAEAAHNESTFAKAVADYLGTDHHELICTTKEAQEIIPKLPRMFDEPFADASAIPTYLLSKFAKQHITAALSADGGDELFGGYSRYQSGNNIYHTFKRFPFGVGPFIWLGVRGVSLLSSLALVHPNRVHKFKKAYEYYKQRKSVAGSYAIQQSYFTDREIPTLLKEQSVSSLKTLFHKVSLQGVHNHLRKLQKIDFHTYLPDDILVKVDRASMAVSLEGREPLLDHHLIEFAASLPDELMHKESGNKYLLRQLLYRYLPRELVDRPKQGFGVPLNEWLKGDLSWLLDTYLDKEMIEKQGIFHYKQVVKERDDFLAGAQPYNRIWNIIVFQMWYKEYFH